MSYICDIFKRVFGHIILCIPIRGVRYAQMEDDIGKIEVPQIKTDVRPQTAEPVGYKQNEESFMLVDASQTPRYQIYMKSYLNRGTIPPIFDRPGVMQYMQRLSINAAMRGDYTEADKYAELNRKFYDQCIEQESEEQVRCQKRNIDNQMATACSKQVELQNKWEDTIKSVEAEESAKMEALLESHRKELAEFDEKWKSEETLRPFTKQSPELLRLRQKEKHLMMIKEFQEAEAVAKHADEIQEQETIKAQQRAEKEALFQRKQLLSKHQKEVSQLQQKAEMRMAALLKKRDKDMEIASIRIAKIESNKSKVGRTRWRDAETACKMRAQTADNTGMLSPRSHQKLEDFRKTSTVPRLVLKPVKKFPRVTSRSLKMPKYQPKNC